MILPNMTHIVRIFLRLTVVKKSSGIFGFVIMVVMILPYSVWRYCAALLGGIFRLTVV